MLSQEKLDWSSNFQLISCMGTYPCWHILVWYGHCSFCPDPFSLSGAVLAKAILSLGYHVVPDTVFAPTNVVELLKFMLSIRTGEIHNGMGAKSAKSWTGIREERE